MLHGCQLQVITDSAGALRELPAHLIDALGKARATEAQDDDLDDGFFELALGPSQQRFTVLCVNRAPIHRHRCEGQSEFATLLNVFHGYLK